MLIYTHHVYACTSMFGCTYNCVQMHVQARGQPQGSSPLLVCVSDVDFSDTKNRGFVSKHQIVPVFVSPLLSLQIFIATLYYFPLGTVSLISTSLPAEPTLQSTIFQINKKPSLFQCPATY